MLDHLIDEADLREAYAFSLQGNSQGLDHILAAEILMSGAEVDIVNVTSEFAETDGCASYQDPALASLDATSSVIRSTSTI